MILCSNPGAGYRARKAEIDRAIERVLVSGRYILGPEVEQFEQEFARYLEVRHAVGVANGTDAIRIALEAAGIGAGAEVITPSHTAVATVAAIRQAGARPAFADIDPRSYTIDPDEVERSVTSRTAAIVAVHLYGHPANMVELNRIARRHGLFLLEDCAQAHGARYSNEKVGSLADAACFSFYPTKNLGAHGDGGMVVTDRAELATKVRALRQYGWGDEAVSSLPGWNSRLDEVQAAILRVKLPYLESDVLRRRQAAERYGRELANADISLPQELQGARHAFHLYVVRSRRRDELRRHLEQAGVLALVHYPVPVHLQPAYRCERTAPLSESERAAQEVLSLPMYPELSDKELDRVIEVVCSFR